MTEIMSDREFASLTEKIARDRGFNCSSYKDRCLRRRIAVRMRARGVQTYEDYAALLDSDATEYERLLEALTINVTRLFRNPETYASIASEIVPEIWRMPDKTLRVWSAGCASGEEPYSLAILLLLHSKKVKDAAGLSRFRVLGTDIDMPSLTAARKGVYTESAFLDTDTSVRTDFFSAGWPASVSDEVKRLVEFRQVDLFGELRLPAPFHLIVCRNVIIYFDKPSQEKLFRRFHSLLAPGGFLVLGKVETILGESRTLFSPVNARERVFRKR